MTDDAYESSPVHFVADHVERYLASDGADGFEFNGAECIILTTTGRRTGKLRRTPLVRVHDGEVAVLHNPGRNRRVVLHDDDMVVTRLRW